ncbi:DUF2442 domain-containing protein [Prosthecobacter dejongeii]|uniref:DUF2442 domain-containing protein n=1 Tax=Prosthecobacter dejongeii TaxID=48465 RepID=A0A7W7YP80_9BACT|nr:DUF2442 domain-containing protein [Prosthecobacter dejongeii]MBB5039682.1 hypothetical protein [Prosthecobacter dejongeii]
MSIITTTPVSLEACEVSSLRVTGPHRVSLHFRDGYVSDLDFADYGNEGGPLRRALSDPGLFAEAYLAYGIVSWPNGYDIAPETLRRYAQQGFIG